MAELTGHGQETALQSIVQELLTDSYDLLASSQAVHSKRVLLRVDFNVPVNSQSVITDSSRIDSSIPTIRALCERGARVILASHFGRPEPAKQSMEDMKEQYSLQPVADYLASQLGDSFTGLVPDCVGTVAEAAVQSLQAGQACLLENVRFHKGETKNDPAFAAALAALADIFVNDAFGVAHRDQSSVTGVPMLIRESYPGPLMLLELRNLCGHLYKPQRPLCVVLGGAKVADKIGIIATLIELADVVVVGGRMAFTFLAAMGVAVGQTQVEKDWLQRCRDMIEQAKARGVQLLLPSDVLISHSLSAAEETRVVPLTLTCCSVEQPCIPSDAYGLDIGPVTTEAFAKAIIRCKTIFWNGPMGKFEVAGFDKGTLGIAEAMQVASTRGSITIVGGGDSVAALHNAGCAEAMSHVSTGGGATLELLEGRHMPGLRALVAARAHTA